MAKVDDEGLESFTTTLDQDIAQVDKVFQETLDKRVSLTNKLESIVNTITITEKDTPRDIESKMSVINTYVTVLSGNEKNVLSKAQLKLKRVEEENTNNRHNELVSTFLQQCGSQSPFKSDTPKENNAVKQEIESSIESQLKDKGEEIKPTELEKDPYNV